MEYKDALDKLKSLNQEHLLKYWHSLNPYQKERLLEQIERLDPKKVHQLQAALRAFRKHDLHPVLPLENIPERGNKEDYAKGLEAIAKGEVGCLIVAGGQASRIRFDGPKGLFPVTNVKHKSLFQLFAEKALAAGKLAGRPLHLAIMTSPINHLITKQYFEEHHFFGLDKSQVDFFTQSQLPILNKEGNLFLEEMHKISEGPDGNGSSLKNFVESRLWVDWQEQGIRYVNFVQIDNPLADPFDPELVGFQKRVNAEVVIKCTPRRNAEEKVGLLVRKGGKVAVVEYTEVSEADRLDKDANGNLKHRCANISLFSFNMDFIKEAADNFDKMPYHPALKAVKKLNEKGISHLEEEPNGWKFEKFIFDILPFAQNTQILIYPREECFAPLKNLIGDDSIATIHKALQQRDRDIAKQITGLEPKIPNFELAQEFYYPTPQLLAKWKGKALPNNTYIEP